jgi:hypothetical protein
MKTQKVRGIGRTIGIAVILLAAVQIAPLSANLRAPRQVDGVFSGALKIGLPPGQVVLLGESLAVRFPEFDVSRLTPRDVVRVSAVYEFENAGSGPVSFPVRFIALDLQDTAAFLNGTALEIRTVESPADKSECLAALASHRTAFLPGFYEGFLVRLKGATENEGRAAELENIPFGKVFLRVFEDPPAVDFPAAEFLLTLVPGKNSLRVQYGQRMFIEERNHGYFKSWPERGFTGFDYLLYPAKSWPMGPDFSLSLTVDVPDVRAKNLFFRVWKRPFLKSNLPLKELPGSARHVRTYRADSRGLPADVLTILLWTDKNGIRHLR